VPFTPCRLLGPTGNGRRRGARSLACHTYTSTSCKLRRQQCTAQRSHSLITCMCPPSWSMLPCQSLTVRNVCWQPERVVRVKQPAVRMKLIIQTYIYTHLLLHIYIHPGTALLYILGQLSYTSWDSCALYVSVLHHCVNASLLLYSVTIHALASMSSLSLSLLLNPIIIMG